MSIISKTLNSKKSLLIIILLLILAITFETFQQLYYLKKFNLVEDVSFFYILKQQSYRWVIWMILGLLIVVYANKEAGKSPYSFRSVFKHFVFILGLVALNILIISTIQLYLNGADFSFSLLINEYITFYLFQKAPIYILGYSAIAIILYFYVSNEKLQFEVQHLSELKDINLNLYNKLKAEVHDKATILNIKIGNKRRIIPVEDIIWIEADDYCVKVHLNIGKSYTMRSSLKSLDAKLPKHFLRVHRKAIVNMKTAKEFNSGNAPFLILKSDQKIPVSKSNFNQVKTFIS